MIQGKKITIRMMEQKDIETYVRLTNDYGEKGTYFPTIIRTFVGTQKIYNETGFFSPKEGRLMIVNQEDEILGFVSYFKTAVYVSGYELGYQIFKANQRGKGYGTEALKLVSAFLFECFPITRLQICMEKENIASEMIAKKGGFTFEGIMRDALRDNGRVITNQVYSMIRSEAPSLKELTLHD